MAQAAEDDDLKSAFTTHLEQTRTHLERLEQIFKLLGQKPQAVECKAIKGILEEGDEVASEFKGEPSLDAGLIAAAQAVEHYEIARYGAMRSWADQLGRDDMAELLAMTLAEEKETDELLTELAESRANQEAEVRG
jgi:ferritin-like metal-binding protein YciE